MFVAPSACVGFSGALGDGGGLSPNGGLYMSGTVLNQSALSSRKNRRSFSRWLSALAQKSRCGDLSAALLGYLNVGNYIMLVSTILCWDFRTC